MLSIPSTLPQPHTPRHLSSPNRNVPFGSPLFSPRAEKSGLAEISGFACRARSLLCKRQLGRQTARCHGSGLGPGANSSRAKTAPSRSRLGVDFRRSDGTGCAVRRSSLGAVAGVKSSIRGEIRAASRLSRPVFKMVFTHCPFGEPARPASATKPGLEVTPEPANRDGRIHHAPGWPSSTALCLDNSRPGRAILWAGTAKSLILNG